MGVKYKFGNGPDPVEPVTAKDDEKSRKQDRKKMQVYW
jgi:hypothetical protein